MAARNNVTVCYRVVAKKAKVECAVSKQGASHDGGQIDLIHGPVNPSAVAFVHTLLLRQAHQPPDTPRAGMTPASSAQCPSGSHEH
jgi:hypothetical protein